MVTWPMTSRDPRTCCEAVRSAILATAWLLVIMHLHTMLSTAEYCYSNSVRPSVSHTVVMCHTIKLLSLPDSPPSFSSVRTKGCYSIWTRSPIMQPWAQLKLAMLMLLSMNNWLIERGLTSPPTQYRLSGTGRRFYRLKDPTNSIKVLKEHKNAQITQKTISTHTHTHTKTMQIP